MSSLAQQIEDITDRPSERARPGPSNKCYPIYGFGDMEDFEAVASLHNRGFVWKEVQEYVDRLKSIESPIPTDKFVYHWRRQCTCWKPSERARV